MCCQFAAGVFYTDCVTVAGCYTLLCVLGLVLLAICRGSTSPLHSAGDIEPTTEQCTPRQAKLQALLLKEFHDQRWSACPAGLWLDVFHSKSPSLERPYAYPAPQVWEAMLQRLVRACRPVSVSKQDLHRHRLQ